MASVPEWMFLAWVPQILSTFDFGTQCFLDELVLRLSASYPSALVYPFGLSYKQFNTNNPQRATRPTVKRILQLLQNPIVEKFIQAITCISLPENVLLTCGKYILTAIFHGKCTNVQYQNYIETAYREVFQNVMRGNLVAKVLSFEKVFLELKDLNRKFTAYLLLCTFHKVTVFLCSGN